MQLKDILLLKLLLLFYHITYITSIYCGILRPLLPLLNKQFLYGMCRGVFFWGGDRVTSCHMSTYPGIM